MATEVLYFGDPMCSWCWGFAPVLTKIRETCEGKVPLRLIMGGLRVAQLQPMNEELKGVIRHHWEEVASHTGQPFDYGFFERESFVYNTEAPCRGVVAIRELFRDSEDHTSEEKGDSSSPAQAFQYYEVVQRAFYAENQDVTSPQVLATLAATLGLEEGRFLTHFGDQGIKRTTHADFVQAMEGGVSGFPTVVLKRDLGGGEENYRLLTMGYQPYEAIEADLEEWLAEVTA